MANFKTPEDDLVDLYVTNVEDIDQYITGELVAWGNNSTYGAVGRIGADTLSPVQIGSVTNDWIDVAMGDYVGAGIKSDGTLWTWGYGGNGAIGNGILLNAQVPTLISGNWKSISGGNSYFSALKQDGSLWTWGYGGNGALGSGSLTTRSVPAQILGGGSWKETSAGYAHAAAIKQDGSLWLWGRNDYGGLGNLDTQNRSSPVQTAATGVNWKQISCGYYHTAAIKTDGSLWTWGLNNYGQLGNNSQTSTSSPVQTVAGGSNWKKVVCGYHGTVALKTDGTLWAWGQGDYGGIGDGTNVSKSSPVQIGTGYKDICEVAYTARAAISNEGNLWVWGGSANIINSGIGDGTALNRSSPVLVTQVGSTWKKASMGWFASAAIVVKD